LAFHRGATKRARSEEGAANKSVKKTTLALEIQPLIIKIFDLF
jgi:hypothetical protein